MSGRLTSEAEVSALVELARQVPAGQEIVEIGAYLGGTTAALAKVAAGCVWAVDLWHLHLPGETSQRRNKKRRPIAFNEPAAFEAFRERTAPYANVRWIMAPSAEVAKAWTRPIGLLFIDGAHDTASVSADYQGWAGWVVPGGHIAFHDAGEGGKVAGVIERIVRADGRWDGWQLVDRLAIARRAG